MLKPYIKRRIKLKKKKQTKTNKNPKTSCHMKNKNIGGIKSYDLR